MQERIVASPADRERAGGSLAKEGLACVPARATATALLQQLSDSMAAIESVNQAVRCVALAARDFSVVVDYTDVNGQQWTRTTGYVARHPDENSTIDLYVDRVELFEKDALGRVKRKAFRGANWAYGGLTRGRSLTLR